MADKPRETKAEAIKAIEAMCLDCSADQLGEVWNCHMDHCPLWAWRSKKAREENLDKSRKISEAQRKEAADRLKKYKEENE